MLCCICFDNFMVEIPLHISLGHELKHFEALGLIGLSIVNMLSSNKNKPMRIYKFLEELSIHRYFQSARNGLNYFAICGKCSMEKIGW